MASWVNPRVKSLRGLEKGISQLVPAYFGRKRTFVITSFGQMSPGETSYSPALKV